MAPPRRVEVKLLACVSKAFDSIVAPIRLSMRAPKNPEIEPITSILRSWEMITAIAEMIAAPRIDAKSPGTDIAPLLPTCTLLQK